LSAHSQTPIPKSRVPGSCALENGKPGSWTLTSIEIRDLDSGRHVHRCHVADTSATRATRDTHPRGHAHGEGTGWTRWPGSVGLGQVEGPSRLLLQAHSCRVHRDARV
jgi:hypothetical protein